MKVQKICWFGGERMWVFFFFFDFFQPEGKKLGFFFFFFFFFVGVRFFRTSHRFLLLLVPDRTRF